MTDRDADEILKAFFFCVALVCAIIVLTVYMGGCAYRCEVVSGVPEGVVRALSGRDTCYITGVDKKTGMTKWRCVNNGF